MRIENTTRNVSDLACRVSATCIWEDCDRPDFEIFFETTPEFSPDCDIEANAFLLAAFVPAMFHGESRLYIDACVCPQLRRGVLAAMRQLEVWYSPQRDKQLQIESTGVRVAETPAPGRSSASFMSGGVDALTVLRQNRLEIPLDHPSSIRDCLFVHGLDLGAHQLFGDNLDHFNWAASRLRDFGEIADFSLLPIRTNAAQLSDNYNLFVTASHGAIIASIAHLFGRRIKDITVASSESVFDSLPWGSSPLLDPHYSSVNITIKHDTACFTRLEKLRFVSQWPDALSVLRVCHDPKRGEKLNCGNCEKCIRTMVGLVVCGKLAGCDAFEDDDISVDRLMTLNQPAKQGELPLRNIHHTETWLELVEPLRQAGRTDLAAIIERKLLERKKQKLTSRRSRFRRLASRMWHRPFFRKNGQSLTS